MNQWRTILCSSRFILIPLQWFLLTFVACQWNWPPIARGFHLFSDYAICFVENSQTNTIIGRIDCKSVHGSGSSTKKLVMLNFIVTQFFVSTVVDALPSTADRWMGWSLLLMAKDVGCFLDRVDDLQLNIQINKSPNVMDCLSTQYALHTPLPAANYQRPTLPRRWVSIAVYIILINYYT